MRNGDTVRMSSVKALGARNGGWTTWAPWNKGEVFVMLCLGIEPKIIANRRDELDRMQAMRDLGWCPESERDELAAEVEKLKAAMAALEASRG